jgi:NAD(P)-dependent dehydrogenase (short-subunit alcohol dehydrogenase family)
VAAELQRQGIEALFVSTQIEQEEAAAAFVQRAVARFGRLDVLVNNAGIRLYQTVVEASAESWETILAVNVKSYAFCAKAAIPAMRQTGGGNIVNVASIRAVTAGGNMTQYDTSKAAVAGLTRGLAMDHAMEGIRVNAVCPGPTFTRFHENRAREADKTPDEFKKTFARGVMLQRPGTPEEVAACILFLASDDASFVTGTCLFVDGGSTAASSTP